MNNLDHVKNFYTENYKMDLSETMKAALSKGPAQGVGGGGVGGGGVGGGGVGGGSVGGGQGPSSTHIGLSLPEIQQATTMPSVGFNSNFVTEKLYMLLQLYLQNKGWNPSVELLQCFSELKDTAMLPSAAHLQILANRLTLDGQGRLVLRENGKIVLPYEHFANAVMLKHMSGPHGLHLSCDGTVRAVMESYSIGRENFGMEKEFVIEVVQSCPAAACRFNKNHPGMQPISPFIDPNYPGIAPDFLQHMPPPLPHLSAMTADDLSKNKNVPQLAHLTKQQQNSIQSQLSAVAAQQQQQQQAQQQAQQQQITAAIIQQQNRAIAQQNLEKFGNMSTIEKQRVLQQLDKKHFEAQNMSNQAPNPNLQLPGLGLMQNSTPMNAVQHSSSPSIPHMPQLPTASQMTIPGLVDLNQKASDQILRSNLDSLEQNKDLLALHNGAWGMQDSHGMTTHGQEKIVRAFTELMRNMTRMKTYIRPSMCKPYGKQSESLQKTLMDTIQIVQSLRGCLPAPHIAVSSWKSEDRHRNNPEISRVEN